MKPITIHLTDDQQVLVECLFDLNKKSAKRNKPGMIMAQLDKDAFGKVYAQVGFIPHKRALKVSAAAIGERHLRTWCKKHGVDFPEDR